MKKICSVTFLTVLLSAILFFWLVPVAAQDVPTVRLKSGEGPTQAMHRFGCNLLNVSTVLELSSLQGRRMDRLPIGQKLTLPEGCSNRPKDAAVIASSRAILAAERIRLHAQLKHHEHVSVVTPKVSNWKEQPATAPALTDGGAENPDVTKAPPTLPGNKSDFGFVGLANNGYNFLFNGPRLSLNAIEIIAAVVVIIVAVFLWWRVLRTRKSRIVLFINETKLVAVRSRIEWDVSSGYPRNPQETYACPYAPDKCEGLHLKAHEVQPHLVEVHKTELFLRESFVDDSSEEEGFLTKFWRFWPIRRIPQFRPKDPAHHDYDVL